MQVSVETTSELSRKITVQVPEETIQEKIDSRLKRMAGQVKVDGFRPGKVPQSVIRRRFGQQVREEVLSEMIQSSFYEAVRDGQLKPVGAPKITAHKAEEGEGLEYEANFEIMPEFVPMPLETLEVKRFVSEVAAEDVDAMVLRLREQRKTWRSVDRPAVPGDQVLIDFEGWHGEESFTNGKTEGFALVLGSGQMIPGFEDRLLGASGGQQLDFELAFPEDYPGAKMAGKLGQFSVQVTAVEEGIVPELDAEFVRSFGIDDGDIDAFCKEIRANMEREMRRALQTRNKTSVMDALYARNTIGLPDSLVQEELNQILAPILKDGRLNQNADEAKLKERFDPMARRRVALALVLGKLIENYGLKVDQARVRAAVDDLATSYEEPEQVVHWYYAQPERLREVENMVMEDVVVELVQEKAQTTEESLSFHELTRPGA